METISFENPHTILDAYESLSRHHLAKKDIREHQLTRISVPQNAKILDIGCGPGFYLRYWLEITKEQSAHFFLLDSSRAALEVCKQIASQSGASHRITTIKADLFSIPAEFKEAFDVVFIGNTLEYIPRPSEYLQHNVVTTLKPGGRLAVREMDCSILTCSHVDTTLCSKVVYSRIASCKIISQKDSTYHNPFMGKELLSILKSSGLESNEMYPYYCEFKAPLTPFEQNYLSKIHVNWYPEDLAKVLSSEERTRWKRHFDLACHDSVLWSEDFFYVESEFLAVGTKRQSH